MPGDCRRLARIDKRVIPPGARILVGYGTELSRDDSYLPTLPICWALRTQAFAQGARSVPNPNPPLTGRDGELSPLDNARGLRDTLSGSGGQKSGCQSRPNLSQFSRRWAVA